jgi:soluble lytic murein transglycosylase-like protein
MQNSDRSLAGWLAIAGLALGALGPAAAADVYYFKDADGVFHFTNTKQPGAVLFLEEDPIAEREAAAEPVIREALLNGQEYDQIIEDCAKENDVEPALVKAVIRAESNFNRMAVSRRGARGLMQLMPTTARHHGVKNAWDARQNIEGGVKHLRALLKRHGNNIPRVIAAYNAGSYPVERYRGVPPFAETRSYVARVLRFRTEYLKRQRSLQEKAGLEGS